MIVYSDTKATLHIDDKIYGNDRIYKSWFLDSTNKPPTTFYQNDDFKLSLLDAGGLKRKFYRTNGLVQYHTYIYDDEFSYSILVDVNCHGIDPTTSQYPFSMSREEVKNELRYTVDKECDKITKNALSAHKIDKPKEFDQKAGHLSQGKGTLDLAFIPYDKSRDNYRGKKVAQVNHNFTRKPTTFDRCLLNLWHDMIQMITEENFGIGFVGEESVRAERYIDDNGFPFYLINPDPMQIDTLDQIIFTIYENACHEIAHVAPGGVLARVLERVVEIHGARFPGLGAP